jgi:hypothetical protein
MKIKNILIGFIVTFIAVGFFSLISYAVGSQFAGYASRHGLIWAGHGPVFNGAYLLFCAAVGVAFIVVVGRSAIIFLNDVGAHIINKLAKRTPYEPL